MKPPKVWRHPYLCFYCRRKRGTPPYDPPWLYRLDTYEIGDDYQWPKWQRWVWRFLGLPRPVRKYDGSFYHVTCQRAHQLARKLGA